LRAVAVTALALPARAANRRKNAPRAVSLRPIVTAANRKRAAARLDDRLVRDDSALPPDILLLCAKQNHAQFEALFSGLDWRKVKALAVCPPTAAE